MSSRGVWLRRFRSLCHIPRKWSPVKYFGKSLRNLLERGSVCTKYEPFTPTIRLGCCHHVVRHHPRPRAAFPMIAAAWAPRVRLYLLSGMMLSAARAAAAHDPADLRRDHRLGLRIRRRLRGAAAGGDAPSTTAANSNARPTAYSSILEFTREKHENVFFLNLRAKTLRK